MSKLIALLKELVSKHFYGEVVIGFKNGKITNVKETRTHDVTEFQD